jgi:hypothetical protein
MSSANAAVVVGWLLLIVGFAVILWGVFAVGFSAGIPPFSKLGLVDIPTLIGPASINDRQFAGGALLVVLGLIIITFGVSLLKGKKHGII